MKLWLNEIKKKKNEAEISTRAFPLESPSKNVNALIARELSGFTCTRSLTMNSKFSIPHSAALCGIEISRSLLVNSCR